MIKCNNSLVSANADPEACFTEIVSAAVLDSFPVLDSLISAKPIENVIGLCAGFDQAPFAFVYRIQDGVRELRCPGRADSRWRGNQ